LPLAFPASDEGQFSVHLQNHKPSALGYQQQQQQGEGGKFLLGILVKN